MTIPSVQKKQQSTQGKGEIYTSY